MANVKEQSAAVKSRQTKISKKTKEELIKIVLRKEQSEINQVRQISKLKEEVNSLKTRLENCIADTEGTSKTLKDLKVKYTTLEDRNKALNEVINYKDTELTDIIDDFDKYKIETKRKIKYLNNIAVTLAVLFVISAMICLIK